MAEWIIILLVCPPACVCCLGFQHNFLFASGSKTVSSFRSPQEFFLHARWLMMGAEEDSEGYPACECKYCGRTRSQREIDQEFQLPGPKDSRLKSSNHHSGRHGASSSAATSGAIISQAKDYRNLKKPNTEYGSHISISQG